MGGFAVGKTFMRFYHFNLYAKVTQNRNSHKENVDVLTLMLLAKIWNSGAHKINCRPDVHFLVRAQMFVFSQGYFVHLFSPHVTGICWFCLYGNHSEGW